MRNSNSFQGNFNIKLNKINFILIVVSRFLKILFLRRKSIKLLHLLYAKNYQFDNSYLIILYRFKNALWYDFKGIKKTIEEDIIILNIKTIPKMPIELIVHGFFRKKSFSISVVPENTIESKLFRTELNGLNNVKKISTSLTLCNSKIAASIPKINLKNTDIQIKHSSFNPTNFI